jgi:hypothetical protein
MIETLNPVAVRPYELKTGDRLGYKIIAVIHYAKDGSGFWAAYKGLTDWDDDVARGGDKLSQEVAEMLFSAPVRLGLTYND